MTPSQNPNLHPLKGVPSGMDNDPHADEEIIDQTGPQTSADETDLQANDKAVGKIPSQQADDPAKDEFLSQKIAYALAGAEPATGDPLSSEVRTREVSDASLEENINP